MRKIFLILLCICLTLTLCSCRIIDFTKPVYENETTIETSYGDKIEVHCRVTNHSSYIIKVWVYVNDEFVRTFSPKGYSEAYKDENTFFGKEGILQEEIKLENGNVIYNFIWGSVSSHDGGKTFTVYALQDSYQQR